MTPRESLERAARAYSESEASAEFIRNNLDYQAFIAGYRYALTSDVVREIIRKGNGLVDASPEEWREALDQWIVAIAAHDKLIKEME